MAMKASGFVILKGNARFCHPEGNARFCHPEGNARFCHPEGNARFCHPEGNARFCHPEGNARFCHPEGNARFCHPEGNARFCHPEGNARFCHPEGNARFCHPEGNARFCHPEGNARRIFRAANTPRGKILRFAQDDNSRLQAMIIYAYAPELANFYYSQCNQSTTKFGMGGQRGFLIFKLRVCIIIFYIKPFQYIVKPERWLRHISCLAEDICADFGIMQNPQIINSSLRQST
ncbi:MAG: hypothetical protein ACOX0F_06335 [Syntrophomonadaceae bacterium]